jgi:hypothetical protein
VRGNSFCDLLHRLNGLRIFSCAEASGFPPDIRRLTNLLDGNAVAGANLALIGDDADRGAIVQLHGVRKSSAIALGSRGDGSAGCCTDEGIARWPTASSDQSDGPTDHCARGRIRLQLDLLHVADDAESNGRSLADTLRLTAAHRRQRDDPDKVP